MFNPIQVEMLRKIAAADRKRADRSFRQLVQALRECPHTDIVSYDTHLAQTIGTDGRYYQCKCCNRILLQADGKFFDITTLNSGVTTVRTINGKEC